MQFTAINNVGGGHINTIPHEILGELIVSPLVWKTIILKQHEWWDVDVPYFGAFYKRWPATLYHIGLKLQVRFLNKRLLSRKD